MLHRSSFLLAAATLVTAASAQTSFSEVEPNDAKTTATPVGCMQAGDSITGTTTGASTTVTGIGSADYFDVQTCTLPAGIYLHRLTLTTTGAAGHGSSIRGVTQSAGVPNSTSDSQYQTGTTSPARVTAWYGFGLGERVYYRTTGTATTMAAYVSTLSTTPVAATPLGSFAPGSISIATIGQTSVDTEVYVYDSTFHPVPTAHNDDRLSPSTLQSELIRTYSPGVYYLVIADFNIANNVSDANPDEFAAVQQLIDFPDALCVRDSDTGLDLDFTISDGVTTLPVTATKPGPFEALFYTFTVGTPVTFEAFCTNASLGGDHTTACPCGNTGAPGNGCGHSFDAGGANLTATGTAANDDVVLHSQFEPATSFTLFLQHTLAGDTVFHDGVLCAGGTLIRLRGRAAVGGEAFFPNNAFPQDQTITLSQRGGVTVGSGARRYYSAWFRNASTTFCPPATANISNGWVMDW